MLNINHPSDYRGRSLSVSDVVEVYESDAVPQGFYFCDSVGFKQVAFHPEECSVSERIQQQISDLKKRFPCIMKVMEDRGEIHLTAEEHAAFVHCLRLSRKLDDMERLQLYFRGHTDAVAYLKKIKAI